MPDFRPARYNEPSFVAPSTWGQSQGYSPYSHDYTWENRWNQYAPWLTGGAIGLGLIGDVIQANQPGLNLPSFAGGGYTEQARRELMPGLQAAYAQSTNLATQERSALGANLAEMGVSGGGKFEAIHNMVRAGQAQRDLQAYAAWQKNITDMAMQLYQFDMQRRAAEYEAQKEGGGFGGFLSQIGQLGVSILPFVL